MTLRARIAAACIIALLPVAAFAASEDDIQSQIDAVNGQKAALDAEIAQYQKQLDALGVEHQTLQGNISTLTTSQKQLQAKISSTQKNIDAANLQLQKLALQIGDTEHAISLESAAVAASLRDIDQSDDLPLVAAVLSSDSLGDAWAAVDAEGQLSRALRSHTSDLAAAKDQLTTHQTEVSGTKQELTGLSTKLGTQNKQLTITKQSQETLLDQTKSKESTYQQLIALKRAQQAEFEETLNDLQSQLKSVGAAAVPKSGTGVLAWPYSAAFAASCQGKAGALKNPYCVTQYFGNTAFATANAQIYNGMGHDGIDIGMPVGTPVLAAAGGTVLATGNTDIKAPDGRMCYSFGKWVMLSHPNGLDTLYAHLSDNTEVSKGQAVTAGQLVGYSGMTGYATGPHLHFGVYVGSGVQIMDLGAWRGSTGTPCTSAGAVLPVAPTDAYLNPMSYL
jgi:murein DD-endopeptidase MepM/ murein hydrolase activator NlpD